MMFFVVILALRRGFTVSGMMLCLYIVEILSYVKQECVPVFYTLNFCVTAKG